MESVKKKDLEALLANIREETGLDLDLDWAYGGVRVCCNGGSRDLSWRGTKTEASRYLFAFVEGWRAGNGQPSVIRKVGEATR